MNISIIIDVDIKPALLKELLDHCFCERNINWSCLLPKYHSMIHPLYSLSLRYSLQEPYVLWIYNSPCHNDEFIIWFYPTFVECYADCFNAISCPIYLIHWTVLHRRVANDFNLWLATNLCNFCLYNLIMPATMISCPLPHIIHGTFDARYQSMLQSMHAQILLKSINKLSFSINPWSLGSFQIVVSSSLLYLA